MTLSRKSPFLNRCLPPSLTGREAIFFLLLLAAAGWGGLGLILEGREEPPSSPVSLYAELMAACPDLDLLAPLQTRPLAGGKGKNALPGPIRDTFPRLAPEDLIDVNRATVRDLCQLPGIGPELAAEIVKYRRRRPFTRPEDLLRIKGIGPKRLETIRSRLVFP